MARNWRRYLLEHPSRAAYREYLASPEWHGKRLAALRRDGDQCRLCGRGERLNVHHLTYARIGKERLTDLRTVCEDCHSGLHEVWQPEPRQKPKLRPKRRQRKPRRRKKASVAQIGDALVASLRRTRSDRPPSQAERWKEARTGIKPPSRDFRTVLAEQYAASRERA